MPLRSDAVGHSLRAITLEVTPRMILAFSAAIGETSEAALNDVSPRFAASPMFCASLEWRLVAAARNRVLGVAPQEALRAVHAGQDSRFLRPLRPGGVVKISGRLTSVRRTRVGALSTTRLDITDAASGALFSRTFSTALFRGVEVEGEDREVGPEVEPALPLGAPSELDEAVIPLDRGFAHRFSECARIWNPIHTERVSALGAGLPDIIVHGAGIWALAGRTLLARYAPDEPQRLRRLSGRFSGMVLAGTPITVRYGRSSADPGRVLFSVLNSDARPAISDGVAEFSPA